MAKKKKKSFIGKILKWIGGLVKKFFQWVIGLPGQVKRNVLSSFSFILSLVSFLGFFDLAGRGGGALDELLFSLFGHGFFIVPLLFLGMGFAFLWVPRRFLSLTCLAGLVTLCSLAGVLDVLRMPSIQGGSVGSYQSRMLVGWFGEIVAFFAFLIASLASLFSIWHVVDRSLFEEEERGLSQRLKDALSSSNFQVLQVEPKKHKEKKKEKKEEEVVPKKSSGESPPLSLLDENKKESQPGNLKEQSRMIQETFDNFDIDVKMAGANVGPTVTQYTLKPPQGVKLSKITGLSNNLALALAAHPVRIEAPIPGKSLVGIEIPNKKRGLVRLKDLLGQPDFKKGELTFPLGENVAGTPAFTDLSGLPHLLVAGATGTGKTVFLNSFLTSLLYGNGPDKMRLILIDPKRVEFSIFSNLPHLLCDVISGAEETVGALSWLVEEMERRFKVISKNGSRNINSYNSKINGHERMPFIVLVIDELADLMVARGKELEGKIVRIAQMARAVGIHLVLATQRPSVEVITGLIKANITTRISFQLPTQTDSRTVLDMSGAEKLLGAGDMLFVSPRQAKPVRIQAVYVSEEEVEKVADWIEINMAEMIPDVDRPASSLREFLDERSGGTEMLAGMEKDPLYGKAQDLVVRAGKGSASLIQRRLRVGYVRAARILDQLEAEGIVGSSRSSKARKVLVDESDIEEDYDDQLGVTDEEV